mmetsp:Transcript_11517/g.17055  ORF Transcript_11517/g.17055 Transcript_11517/m.17055 type:complete len:329 (-) Transcript_11517:742-1728(-)
MLTQKLKPYTKWLTVGGLAALSIAYTAWDNQLTEEEQKEMELRETRSTKFESHYRMVFSYLEDMLPRLSNDIIQRLRVPQVTTTTNSPEEREVAFKVVQEVTLARVFSSVYALTMMYHLMAIQLTLIGNHFIQLGDNVDDMINDEWQVEFISRYAEAMEHHAIPLICVEVRNAVSHALQDISPTALLNVDGMTDYRTIFLKQKETWLDAIRQVESKLKTILVSTCEQVTLSQPLHHTFMDILESQSYARSLTDAFDASNQVLLAALAREFKSMKDDTTLAHFIPPLSAHLPLIFETSIDKNPYGQHLQDTLLLKHYFYAIFCSSIPKK